jgi:signal transduction histidine kinase
VIAQEVSASMMSGTRALAVKAEAFSAWTCRYSARVQIGDQEHELHSSEGELLAGTAAAETETTPHGSAVITSRSIDFPQHGVRMIFRLGRGEDKTSLLMQVGIKNIGKNSVRLISVAPLIADFAVEGGANRWWVTALNDSVNYSQPIHSLSEISNNLRIRECGGFYRDDGKGFLFGPVGTPIAFVDTWLTRSLDNHVTLSCVADMSRVRVDAGETRWGQQVVAMVTSPRVALPAWADWVGSTHDARSRHGGLSGWNSWNFLGGQVSGDDILSVVNACEKTPERLRPQVIQIDGGFEDSSGAKDSNERFPEGLEFYAKKISESGARPGILLEMGVEPAQLLEWNVAAERAALFVKKGYKYIKVNTQNMTWGTLPASDRKTSFELLREGFFSIRKAVGDDVYLLNGDLRPNRAAVGIMDAQRIGVESKRANLRPTIDDALRNFHIQGAWGAIDADAYYLGTDLENISSIAGGWPLVRTWVSMIGLSGGAAITSDPWYWDSFKPHLRNVETMTPTATGRASVLDLCTGREFSRMVKKTSHEGGDLTVALLWNPGNAERTVSLDFQEAGMSSQSRYAVWSFWDNRFLGVAKGSWNTPSMAPSASQHLRFTDLDRFPDRPVLIGSNLHISCGAAEIQRVTSLQGGMEIELTDAGAREGDLFIYSRLLPVLKSATGCTVDKISYAGENVWRISLVGRRSGNAQRLEMSIQLPFWKQPLFWLLIVLALISMFIAVWRYLASLRLAREHALQQERSRIAQDLHDNIGANLAHIGLLTEHVEQSLENPEEVREHLNQIFHVSHTTARELDAVVWAVNPSNDTLEEFARYVHGYAENYLGLTGIRCHFTNTSTLPHLHLSSTMRHHLLMIVKEALHNVSDHATASLVLFHIGTIKKGIMLEIKDDGCGLPTGELLTRGNGLQNMKSRASELGGICEISSSSSEKGTTVRITMPMQL